MYNTHVRLIFPFSLQAKLYTTGDRKKEWKMPQVLYTSHIHTYCTGVKVVKR